MKSLRHQISALFLGVVLLLLSSPSANAQILSGSSSEQVDAARTTLGQSYSQYGFEEFLGRLERDQLAASTDSLSDLRAKILATPSELRKMGVSEEIIGEMVRLNAIQDSLYYIGSGIEDALSGDFNAADSISIFDVQSIVEWQKRQLYEKAFDLPEAMVYGHEFFRKNLFKLSPGSPTHFRAPDNYVLGQGDEVGVVVWGNNDFNAVYQIDENGSINPSLVGKIYLQGLTYGKAKSMLTSRFSQVYGADKNQFEITVIRTRDVSVNIVGEVFNPGSYSFNSINSAFDALVAMEGPNQMGSVRTIAVKRGGAAVKELDVYEYLLDPNSEQDFFLENNDYVFVPPIGNVVNIAGEVKRPHNYEMKEGEGIQDLIKYAGALEASAYTKNINVKRFADNAELLIDVNLDSLVNNGHRFEMMDGDSVFVRRVPSTLSNYVELMGSVQVPGKYELRQGDRISDVMYRARGPLEEADLEEAYVLRLDDQLTKEVIPFDLQKALLDQSSTNNVLLKSRDTIRVVAKERYRERYILYVAGEVNDPGDYEYGRGMKLWDVIRMAGGIKREAANSRIEISRLVTGLNPDKPFDARADRITTKRIEISAELQISEADKSFELQPYDQVFVRLSPDFEEQQKVIIVGEIMYPGEYTLSRKDERIESLVSRAGGFSNYASPSAAKLYRSEEELGMIIVDLEEALENPDRSEFNYLLTNGDSIVIPKLKDFVTLRGAIRHFEMDSIEQVNVPYRGKHNAKHYIKQHGGGFGKHASRFRTYVQQPNGEVEKTQKVLFAFNRYPVVQEGATIFVDITEYKRREPMRLESRRDRDWNEVFNSTAAKIGAVISVLILLNQVTK